MEEELRLIFASNLIRLRTAMNLTQAELGSRLNYSDKTVSKWERAESLPGVLTLKQMAELFGVTTDYLLSSHDDWENNVTEEEEAAGVEFSVSAVIHVSVLSLLTMAVLLFVILWIFGYIYWSIFIYVIPVILVTVLVLNSIFREGRQNYYIVSALVLSLLAVLGTVMERYNPWQLVLVAVPAELLVFFSFKIKKKSKFFHSTLSRMRK